MISDKKIALVTGASRGIGQAIAKTIAEQGIFVVGTEITPEGAAVIDRYFKEHGLEGCGQVVDITDSEAVHKLIDTIQTQYGPIQILVNNAGITRDNLMLRMKPEEWQAVIDTNLNGVFCITQRCLKDMLKLKWGRIINISSIVGAIGNAGQTNYCAAKAGLLGFTKALAQEVASRNITVNAIAPGFIDTPMTQKLSDAQKEALLSTIPMKRMGLPQDIASGIVFLVSERASYITGQTLHINGGMYMT